MCPSLPPSVLPTGRPDLCNCVPGWTGAWLRLCVCECVCVCCERVCVLYSAHLCLGCPVFEVKHQSHSDDHDSWHARPYPVNVWLSNHESKRAQVLAINFQFGTVQEITKKWRLTKKRVNYKKYSREKRVPELTQARVAQWEGPEPQQLITLLLTNSAQR